MKRVEFQVSLRLIADLLHMPPTSTISHVFHEHMGTLTLMVDDDTLEDRGAIRKCTPTVTRINGPLGLVDQVWDWGFHE